MRGLITLVLSGWLVSVAAAQSVVLVDEVKAGEHFRYEIGLNLAGKLKVERNGKPEALAIAAGAGHVFVERAEAVEASGITKTIRHYEKALSQGDSAGERTNRELAADRRLIVSQRTKGAHLHFSPDGPLAREELELVAEHFDTLSISQLLPGKETKLNDTWTLRPDVVQQVCQFEGVVKSELVGKLVEVTAEEAKFTITGAAEGVDNGAQVKLSVNAVGVYSLATKRITKLGWEQTDDRAQGAASPASEVKATIQLSRTPLAEEPKSLDITARAKMPSDAKATEAMTMLRHVDRDGRFQFVYPRDWHIVGRTKDHIVLRLLDGGEFTAQATMTIMKKLEPGSQMPIDDFKRLLGQIPGWEPEGISEDGIISSEEGRRLYRLTAKGKQDGVAVQQTFFHIAGPKGDQIAVTVLAKDTKAGALNNRDLSLVNAITFPK
ncbi:MAG: hypothetical protein ACRC8S_07330 [Fimbriiglobus sp.]